MSNSEYIGRFAPSPTGRLHLGSLMTAIASYCDAKINKGKWLIRIEDLDPPREIKGASQEIIKSLNIYGFEFDQNIIFQSHIKRQEEYQKTLFKLIDMQAVYKCSCSRSQLKNTSILDHSCRYNSNINNVEHSVKLKVPDIKESFNDQIQGVYEKNLLQDCGDCVLLRRDSLFAYQLAVVVDDHRQGVTNIVRGIDLLDSTPWQIYLNSLLGYHQCQYAHIPILVNKQDQKLSKQTFATEISNSHVIDTLLKAYSYLNQRSFNKKPQNLFQFWNHAINNWNINKISNISSIKV